MSGITNQIHETRHPGGALIAKSEVFISGSGHIRTFTVVGVKYADRPDAFKYIKSLTDTLNSYKLKPEALNAVSDLIKVYMDELHILLEDYEPEYFSRPNPVTIFDDVICNNCGADIHPSVVSSKNN